MSNTHGQPDTLKETQSICGDLLPACLLTSAGVTAPGSGLTITAASCTAYARSGVDLVYIDQPAVSVTVPNVAGSHWLIAHRDTYSAVASWTRRAGSHFLTQQAATQPTIPDACVLVAQLTVAGGNLTAVDTTPALSPPLSRQTADAVAITDGRISLGGHAPTGVLDVQSSVVASDFANGYFGVRVWPVAPSGALNVHGVRVEPATGDAAATANHAALVVQNAPTTSGNVHGVWLNTSAGTGRYNVAAVGTAQNYFAGAVGIAQNAPLYPLDVSGTVRLMGNVGLQTTPIGTASLFLRHDKSAAHGIIIQPTVTDTVTTSEIVFQNVAGTTVGSIQTTSAGTAYQTTSDGRLKYAVKALADALDAIMALRPVAFTWRADDRPGQGFIASEVQAVIPAAVSGAPDALDAAGHIIPQQMDFSRVIPHLVGAVQRVVQRLEVLEAWASSARAGHAGDRPAWESGQP